MTASGLEKSDLGKNRFYSALNMPYPNGKIIGAESVRTFIGNSGWPATYNTTYAGRCSERLPITLRNHIICAMLQKCNATRKTFNKLHYK